MNDETKQEDRQQQDRERRRRNGGIYNAVSPTPAPAFSFHRFTRIGCLPSLPPIAPFMHQRLMMLTKSARCGNQTRNARTGSIRVARRAGRKQASSATPSNTSRAKP